MVTTNRVGGQETDLGAEIYGLSTDTKPISKEIPNGSAFIEIDTLNVWLYDAENQQWKRPTTE
jgi:hypothetical protein